MRIVIVRRIAQVFFLLLFLWFCVASTFGAKWWQLRGWPVNWFLELDPLVTVGTILSTHTIYRGLLWSLVTVVLTIIFGRFFCGWVCPFGTLHQFFGYLGMRGRRMKERRAAHQYRKAQLIKYYVLILFLVMAALPIGSSVSLQTGLLDPIPLIQRSVNLALLPIVESVSRPLSAAPRQYEGTLIIGGIFLTALLLNFVIPRFYCRIICPLGALFGLLSRYSVWRIGRVNMECTHCELCETACEGACEPGDKIHISECLLCFNCVDNRCHKKYIGYRAEESISGENTAPDLGRRGVLVALAASAMAVPMIRLNGGLASNWHHKLVRPPGSLTESEFLERCIKCGQCIRICPTNVIVPASIEGGFEQLWTPVLNFRIGTSGCQLNCTACGHICPVAAIRPITLKQKLGLDEFAEAGPIRIGAAFVDRGRCLPWAMDTPCIVCQENCPVTPKAIYLKEFYNTVRFGALKVTKVTGNDVEVFGEYLTPGRYATGDYFLARADGGAAHPCIRIVSNTGTGFTLTEAPQFKPGEHIDLQVKLQAPCVDITRCIGCGVCEHECPVSGLRAIRVSAENETRNTKNSLTLERNRV
ncbi:MAG: 4Fe-4S binding protein [bacterium]|nr:4Fe-4S binding protein [Candidatus Sumerlaeota bacterium]